MNVLNGVWSDISQQELQNRINLLLKKLVLKT